MTSGISGIGTSSFIPPIAQPKQADSAAGSSFQDSTAGGSFQKMLTDAESTLNGLQADADSSINKLAAGQPVELHEAMLATEKASIAFQFAVQVRNKVIEAYQEVMRMQV